MFRSTRDGGVTVRLTGGEATLLSTLVVPVMELLNDPERPSPPSEAAAPDDSADVLADLERQFSSPDEPDPELPADPVVARLLPDAYQDDPEKAGRVPQVHRVLAAAGGQEVLLVQTLLETLPADGGKIRLTGDQARDWLRALNDIRLMFGVRLEVTEDFEDQLAALDPKDPRLPAFEVYGWLGAVQESLVHALGR